MTQKSFFTIPYVNTISERFTPIVNMFNCKLAFTIPNVLKKFIKRGKDRTSVVYRISCENCDVSYIGQTKRQLKTRLHEHVSDINISSKSPSVISNHRMEENHNFKRDKMNIYKVDILDIEPSFNKRLISEMIHIKKHGINRQNDTESLPEAYSNVILFLLPNIFFPSPFPLFAIFRS
ncbi:hypothetical protein ALC56_01823 [Trachymyrmex septentrionalis]|uniref:GIY-YIG domain-containing protein n=1 Tax=Trachymyrmex septentrionalis TaxID=34720 RepID=A0A195FTC8_9HYME|nr:hypothetical protein ALC56_01823 [Trachymyrmex septentrionalis]